MVKPAYQTVFWNGVLVHNRKEVMGPMIYRDVASYKTPHAAELPLMLQDHNNPVRYRNIWVRRLKGYDGRVYTLSSATFNLVGRWILKRTTRIYDPRLRQDYTFQPTRSLDVSTLSNNMWTTRGVQPRLAKLRRPHRGTVQGGSQ